MVRLSDRCHLRVTDAKIKSDLDALGLDPAGTMMAISTIGADDRIEGISDYQRWPWVITAGSIVVREFVG